MAASLLRDVEALNTQPVPTLGIPRAIGAVFDRQSRRLDPVVRAALDLAAVLGRRLTDLALYAAVGVAPLPRSGPYGQAGRKAWSDDLRDKDGPRRVCDDQSVCVVPAKIEALHDNRLSGSGMDCGRTRESDDDL